MPVPIRPLLAPWYRLVADGDRMLLEHARSVVVLEGAAVRALLPKLLPLLDGSRTVEELCGRFGSAVRPAVDSALAVLDSSGLLLEGPDVAVGMREVTHAAAAATGLSPGRAFERLAQARVGIVGSSPSGAAVARLLHAAGLPDVRRLSWRGGRDVDLAVVLPANDEIEALSSWNRVALEQGIRWLGVRPFDGLIAAVGPLVVPGESACYECLLRRVAANVDYGDDLAEIESAPISARPDAPFDGLVTALVAHLAFRWVIGRDTTLPGVLHVVEARPAFAVGTHDVLRVPRCSVCSDAVRLAAPLPWHEAAAA